MHGGCVLCVNLVFQSSFLWCFWSTDELSAVRNAKKEMAVPSRAVGTASWWVHHSAEFMKLMGQHGCGRGVHQLYRLAEASEVMSVIPLLHGWLKCFLGLKISTTYFCLERIYIWKSPLIWAQLLHARAPTLKAAFLHSWNLLKQLLLPSKTNQRSRIPLQWYSPKALFWWTKVSWLVCFLEDSQCVLFD